MQSLRHLHMYEGTVTVSSRVGCRNTNVQTVVGNGSETTKVEQIQTFSSVVASVVRDELQGNKYCVGSQPPRTSPIMSQKGLESKQKEGQCLRNADESYDYFRR